MKIDPLPYSGRGYGALGGKNARREAISFWKESLCFVWCVVCCLFSSAVWAEEKEPIVIVCPEMQEPYRMVFAEMADGVNSALQSTPPLYMVSGKSDVNDLQQKIKQSGAKVIVTLGRQGLKVVAGVGGDLPVVLGGVMSAPEENTGHTVVGLSLTPDPMPMFTRLKNLLPEVKKVVVVYNPKYTGWLMKFAQEAAKSNGMELEAIAVTSTELAAQQYQKIFSNIERGKVALWLPQDATSVDERVILPFVLKEIWERAIPTISSSLSHVQRGVLFAMYPDNKKFGVALGELAVHVAHADRIASPFRPFRNVQSTVNARIATHLGVQPAALQRYPFDSVLSAER
jgi:putative tryptophan/tyrosine transport system substrate-binding protein